MTGTDDNWRLMADRQLAPQLEGADQDAWRQVLADRYALEVAPEHNALWEKALGLLVLYGRPLCYKETPLRQYPMGAPLSTGALVLERPSRRGSATVLNAVRISAANHNLRFSHLPQREIARGAKDRNGRHFDAAVRALGSYTGLTVIRVDTMVLATEVNALIDTDHMRGTLLETEPPFGYRGRMLFGQKFSTDENRKLFAALRSKPEVALYRRPLEIFDHRDFTEIRRPTPPQVSIPRGVSLEEAQRLLDKALRTAKQEQPHVTKLLDIVSQAGRPVREVLGDRAVARTIFA